MLWMFWFFNHVFFFPINAGCRPWNTITGLNYLYMITEDDGDFDTLRQVCQNCGGDVAIFNTSDTAVLTTFISFEIHVERLTHSPTHPHLYADLPLFKFTVMVLPPTFKVFFPLITYHANENTLFCIIYVPCSK